MDNQIIVPHVEGAQGIRPAMLFESDHLEPIVILRASDRYFVDVLQRYKTAVREDPNADPALLAALDDAIIAANQWRSSGNPVASPAAPLPQKPFMLPADMKITAEATGEVTPPPDSIYDDAHPLGSLIGDILYSGKAAMFKYLADNGMAPVEGASMVDIAREMGHHAGYIVDTPEPRAVTTIQGAQTITADPQGGTVTTTDDVAQAIRDQAPSAVAGTPENAAALNESLEQAKAGDTVPVVGVDLAAPGGDTTSVTNSDMLGGGAAYLTADEILAQLADGTIRDAIAHRGGFISANASTAQCAALLADLGYPVGKP